MHRKVQNYTGRFHTLCTQPLPLLTSRITLLQGQNQDVDTDEVCVGAFLTLETRGHEGIREKNSASLKTGRN